jgi:hypothetical protein
MPVAVHFIKHSMKHPSQFVDHLVQSRAARQVAYYGVPAATSINLHECYRSKVEVWLPKASTTTAPIGCLEIIRSGSTAPNCYSLAGATGTRLNWHPFQTFRSEPLAIPVTYIDKVYDKAED